MTTEKIVAIERPAIVGYLSGNLDGFQAVQAVETLKQEGLYLEAAALAAFILGLERARELFPELVVQLREVERERLLPLAISGAARVPEVVYGD